MWSKVAKTILIALCILAVILALGPKPDYPRYDLSPIYLRVQLKDLDSYVAAKEATVSDLKPDNEAKVVWYQDSIQKTPYSLVYLHGFSASQEEGDPVHTTFAKKYGMNLYLSRLADHGRSAKNSFENLTPKDLIESAKEAIAIGALLGEKVILMSCSTGSTYSIMLAPEDDRVHSLLMYSPNIGIKDPSAALVTYPWGKQILRGVMGGDYNRVQYTEAAKQYWNDTYHVDGIVAMQSLIDDGMQAEYFEELKLPFYLGCYYKDESAQDQVVSVARMEEFFDQVGTPATLKKMVRFPAAGRHVFTSHIMVADVEEVMHSTEQYVQEVLGLQPVDTAY